MKKYVLLREITSRQMDKVAWSASHDSVMRGADMALAFSMALDTMILFNDYREGKKDLYDLFATLGVDMAKAFLVAGVTSAVVSGLLTAAATISTTGIAIPLLAVAIGTAIFTVVIAYVVDWMFDRAKVSERLTTAIHTAGKFLEETISLDYGDTYSASQWMIIP